MNSLLSAKTLAVAAIAVGGIAAASAAQARSDVVLSIGFNSPYHVQPAPVYVAPQPIYYQAPQPIYYHGNHYRHVPRTGPYGDWDRDGIPNRFDRDRHHRGGRWDADRDGVPNRYDRAPGNPYRY